MKYNDTIVAQATAFGRAGVGILRISGKKTSNIAKNILGKLPKARYAEYLPFKDKDKNIIDHGIALWFPGPKSFTGEDVLELQGHGGQVILELLLKNILKFPNIRIAKPGEFLERAFINNKVDLTQAEAISDLINAESEETAKYALQSIQGFFSKQINNILKILIELRVYIESNLNFPDEKINSSSDKIIETKLNKIINELNQIYSKSQQEIMRRKGIKIVISGPPNAGKSTLLNTLIGYQIAIVTDIPGTTRDLLKESIHINGIPIQFVDTAGLPNTTNNKIEQIGIKLAWKEIQQANQILFVMDSNNYEIKQITNLISSFPKEIPMIIVRNKSDISNEKPGLSMIEINGKLSISISARTGEGIEILRDYIKKSVGMKHNNAEIRFFAKQRHLEAIKKTCKYLKKAKNHLLNSSIYEMIAEELNLAQRSLGEITGTFSSEELLNEIFSKFCIGK